MIGYTLQYDSDISKINYIKGSYIFINLLDKINVTIDTEQAKKTINTLHDLGMKVIVDVNDNALAKHNINLETLNKDWKIDYLRIDEAKNYKKVISFLTVVGLALNCSSLSETELSIIVEEIKQLELDDLSKQNILWIHNHYPKIGTGLPTKYFLKQNKILKATGGKICSFISGDEVISPEYNFLPTLEDERYSNVYLAYLKHDLIYNMDIVFIGEKIISEFDHQAINDYIEKDLITIPVDNWFAKQKEFLNKEIHIRKDFGNNFLRIAEARPYYLFIEKIIIDPENNDKVDGKTGMIILDNKDAENYAGDLSIIAKDIVINNKSNFVGQISENYLELIKYLYYEKKLIFKLA